MRNALEIPAEYLVGVDRLDRRRVEHLFFIALRLSLPIGLHNGAECSTHQLNWFSTVMFLPRPPAVM